MRSSSKSNQLLYLALGVAVIVIAYLMFFKKSSSPPPPQAQPPPPPPPQQPPIQPTPPPPPQAETILGTGNKPAIVMFYAKWCGPSRATLPAWQKLESALMGSPVIALGLEESEHNEEMRKHNIAGFPTIRLYPEGFPSQEFVDYKGPRTFESLMKFVQTKGKEA